MANYLSVLKDLLDGDNNSSAKTSGNTTQKTKKKKKDKSLSSSPSSRVGAYRAQRDRTSTKEPKQTKQKKTTKSTKTKSNTSNTKASEERGQRLNSSQTQPKGNLAPSARELAPTREKRTDTDRAAPTDFRDKLLYSASDISPTRAAFMMAGANPSQDERKWFEKGAFEDGYDFGDITKTILGSVSDISENIDTGIIGMGEKVVDTMAMLAPGAYQGAAIRHGGQQGFDFDEYNEQKKAVDEFVAKDLYDEEKVAKTILASPFNRLTQLAGIDSEADSVFGEKSDSLVQSAGQLAATIGLSGVGVPWWVTTGATTFGAEAETALKEGATHEEATLSAAITAAAEILSEKIFGGIKFGGKTLDMGITKALSRGISNKFVRTAVDLGVGGLGEGLEEIVSNFGSSFGKWLTYQDEETLKELLFSEEAMDEHLEAFIGGMVLGGGSKAVNAVQSSQKGVDAVTGLTENEQKVVDALYEERIAEEEANDKGRRRKKSEIYDELLEDMERGYITTDDIERVLGGEEYKSYRETVDSEDAQIKQLQEQLKELDEAANTVGNAKRYDAIQSQIDELMENAKHRDGLRAQLSKNVFDMVKNDRLRESYFEVVRSKQKFDVDLDKYEGRAKEVMRKVMESELADNSNQSHEFWDLMANLSTRMDSDITLANDEQILEMVKEQYKAEGREFDESKFKGQRIDGFIGKDGIVINSQTKRALNFVVGHEITHALEKTKHYGKFQKLFLEFAQDEYESRYNERAEQYGNKFADDSTFKAKVDQEITGDLTGDYLFTDKNFVTHLTKDADVFNTVLDEIKYMAKIATTGSQTQRQLLRVQREFERAWRERNKEATDTKYSLTDSDGKQMADGNYSVAEVPLEERLSGDALLDAEDLIAEIENIADISPNGYVTVYHRTTAENAKRIMESGKMSAKEDGIFFSTQKDGAYSADYGDGIVELKVPVEKFVLDDIFDSEAHLRIPLENRNKTLDVSEYLPSSNPTTDPDIRYSLSEDSVAQKINESLTMQEAKQMIQRAFVLGGIKEWYDGEYANGDEWLKGEGAEDVAMIIENEYSLQTAYIDKIPGLLNEEFYLTDVLDAYTAGTLTGKVKKTSERVNLADGVAVADKRFYAPKEIENAKVLYEVANQRLTNDNRDDVSKARAAILLYAHNKGAAETLGISNSELNKKLRAWGGYSAKARDISMRINSGVHSANRWTGIENVSWINKTTVSNDDVVRMVKSVEGNGDDYQNNYIARTMLSLDTHIDWSWLTVKFDSYAGVNASQNTHSSKCNGYYNNHNRLIHVKYDAPNTVAHEMGHALDYQWGRDLGYHMPLTEISRATEGISGEARVWFNNFKEFEDSLIASSDTRSAYSMDAKETFARFVSKFVEWTEQIGTGRTSGYESSFYNDNFTGSQFVQFARLLQEKSAIDSRGLTGNKFSLSDINEQPTKRSGWNVYGKDILLDKGDAPVSEIDSMMEDLTDEQVAGVEHLYELGDQRDQVLEQALTLDAKEGKSDAEIADMERLYAQADELRNEIETRIDELFPDELAPMAEEIVTEQQSENLASITDADAPMEAGVAPVAEMVQPVQEAAQPVEAPVAPTQQTKAQPKPVAALQKGDRAPVATKDSRVVKNKQTSLKNLLTAALVDKGAVFERMSIKDKNPELQAKYKAIARAESAAQYFLQNGADGVKSMKSVMQEIEKQGLGEEFDMFLKHMLNTDRMSLRTRFGIRNKTVFGDRTTAKQSQAEAARMLREHPQFKEWSNAIYAITRHNLKMQVDNRLITQETADKWLNMYPHYVPIARDVTDNNQQVNNRDSKVAVKNLNKRATGGTQKILSMMETLADRTIQTYKAVAKNNFGVELKNMLGSVVSVEDATTRANGNIIENGTRVRASDRNNIGTVVGYDADSKSYSVRFENTQTGKTATVTLDANAITPIGTMEDIVDRANWHEEMIQNGNPGRNPTFSIYEGGNKITFEITDEMYQAMQPAQGLLGREIKPLSWANNLRRSLLTEYNIGFLATNAIKDAQDVLINSQHPIRTYANVPEAIRELRSKGKWYQERMSHGGAQDTYFNRDTQTFTKEKSVLRKTIGFPLDLISKANNFIEQIPRMAEYIASRKMGHSIDVSMMHAARVTTDFSAGGDVTKFFNRHGVTFLNASVQGAAQHVRNIREAKANGIKGMLALGAKITAAGLPFILLNDLLWGDDEEYEELSDYIKQNYYIVGKYGDGQFVRIPKGRALAVVQNAFEQMEKLVKGEEVTADDIKTFGELMISNLAPNNPLDNNLLAPIGQAFRNETWYGEDLVPSRLQDVPAAEQYDESTDAISKWLGETAGNLGFDLSPMKINYVLDQYSGVVGDTLLPMMTLEAESGADSFLGDLVAPIKDKFTADSTMDNQNVTDFYNLKDELTVNANSMHATDDDKLKSLYMNSVSSDLADLYAEKREIQNSDLSDSEKYEQIREIQAEIVEYMENGMDTYQDINYKEDRRTDDSYAEIGDYVFKLDDNGNWKKLDEEQMTKYEVTQSAGRNDDVATDGEHYYQWNEDEEEWRTMNDDQITKYEITSKVEDGVMYASDGLFNHYRWYEPGEDASADAEAGWRRISRDELERQREVTDGLGITPEEYWSNKDEYSYAYDYPDNYAVAQAVGGYDVYREYSSALYDIKADKDEYGRSISGSRKEKVIDYINALDADYYTKIILYKREYNSDDTYNNEIIEYLNSREDISYDEMKSILLKLGFLVDAEGNISW